MMTSLLIVRIVSQAGICRIIGKDGIVRVTKAAVSRILSAIGSRKDPNAVKPVGDSCKQKQKGGRFRVPVNEQNDKTRNEKHSQNCQLVCIGQKQASAPLPFLCTRLPERSHILSSFCGCYLETIERLFRWEGEFHACMKIQSQSGITEGFFIFLI